MKILIVHAHPEPQSFVGALRDAAIEELTRLGHEVRGSDLYAMGFQPASDRRDFTEAVDQDYLKPQREQMHASERGSFAPDVAEEIQKLFWCDFMIFTFPLWWFGLPGILKGWVDRVFVMGKVYGGGRVYESGLLRGRRAMLALSTGGPESSYLLGGRNGSMLSLLYPIHHGMLWFIGMEVLPPFVAYGPARVTPEERAAALASFRERLRALETTPSLNLDLLGF